MACNEVEPYWNVNVEEDLPDDDIPFNEVEPYWNVNLDVKQWECTMIKNEVEPYWNVNGITPDNIKVLEK